MRKLIEHFMEKKPRSEEEREQLEFEQRFSKLPKAEQDTYFQGMLGRMWLDEFAHLREGKLGRLANRDLAVKALETADKRWSRFALSMLEAIHTPLKRYAGNPESFEKLKDRFALVPLISHVGTAHKSELPYGRRSSYETESVSKDSIAMDSPFGYVVRYLNSKDKWEVISVLTFVPDFENGVLYVDQVQGGNTSRGRASEDGRDAHYKFEKPPLETLETALYDVARDLARRYGMKEVALRKGEHNWWVAVKDKAEKTATVYERIALLRGMQNKEEDEYYRESLVAN